MKKFSKSVALSAVLACVFAATACAGSNVDMEMDELQTVDLPEYGFSFALPASWADGNDPVRGIAVDMVASNNSMGVTVLVSSAASFADGTTLGEYLAAYTENLVVDPSVTDSDYGEMQETGVGTNGIPAAQQAVEVAAGKSVQVYHMTAVRNNSYFFVIGFRTMKSNFKVQKPFFDEVLATINVVDIKPEGEAGAEAGTNGAPGEIPMPKPEADSVATPDTVFSWGGGTGFSIMAPSDWTENDAAPGLVLALTSSDGATSFMVDAISIADFEPGLTLDQFADTMTSHFVEFIESDEASALVEKGEKLAGTVGAGAPAVNQTIEFGREAVNMKQMFTYFSDGEYFYQLTLASLPSYYQKTLPLYEEMLKTVTTTGMDSPLFTAKSIPSTALATDPAP